VLAVYEKTMEAAEACREGEGPVMIEAKTYRHGGHHVNDPGLYMPKDRLEYYKDRDPVKLARAYLMEQAECSEERISAIERQAQEAMEQAVEYAKNCPEPSLEAFLEEVERN
jgi:TPP-dependent pyruvate/acetoin dehydrogenase alpha subunit